MPPDYRKLIDDDGPGRFDRLCALLQQVERHGSLRRATEELGLSYRYAWGMIRQAERRLGEPLLVSRTGGASGGGAELTSTARDLVHRHRLLQRELSAILAPAPESPGGEQPLLMASTIGPVESGLVDALATAYRAASGVWIRYIAAGTGQALAVARSGRVDLVLAHAPALEEEFVREGYGTKRYPLALNTFLLVGPVADPAGAAGSPTAVEALRRIAAAQAPFVSRGDQSGTHLKEMELWEAAGIAPEPPWYRLWHLGGQGSAATLRHAASVGAYTLVDSATYATVRPAGYAVVVEGDPLLCNRFSLIPVNPNRFPSVNAAGAERFAAWATGPEGRAIIRAFGAKEHGIPLFQAPE